MASQPVQAVTPAAAVSMPVASAPKRKVKTILGVDLRRLLAGTIRSLARGKDIRVVFRGTRAYTDGSLVVLPHIRDLAEIEYEKARALVGYAIHELGHILFTDFTQVERAFNEGKLVKMFENCIEDYRIERELVRIFPGAKDDLTALRIRIHPRLSDLTDGWLRDPRACGPLALTWTGSRLNGFRNPHLQQTLDAIAAPVMAMIDDWTNRMEFVENTEGAVDLAIAFKAEADAYAKLTQDIADDAAKQEADPDADGQDADHGADDAGSDDTGAGDGSGISDTPSDEPDADNDTVAGGDQNASDAAQNGEDAEQDQDGQPAQDEPADDTSDTGNANSSAGDAESGPAQSGDGSDAGVSDNGASDQSNDFDFDAGSAGNANAPNGSPKPSENGSISMDGDGLLDDPDAKNSKPGESGEASDAQPSPGTSDQKGEEIDPAQRDDDDADRSNDKPMDGPAGEDAQDGPCEDDDRGFGDSIDGKASLEDMLDDLRDAIADDVRSKGALPSDAPEATDGEVDPTSLEEDMGEANVAAPDYTSSDDFGDASQKGAMNHEYDDKRFSDVERSDEGCQYQALRTAAAGVITTTARTIKRLLMAESKTGTMINRRSGQFDIRNMSAIIRQTGSCYKKTWSQPSPTTLLAVLTDFSGSMKYTGSYGQDDQAQLPITLAMMSALAIEQATQGTQVDTEIYGYSGYSPHVNLSIFKGRKQSRIETRRRLGAYGSVRMDCTPTAEAMAAVASRIENAENNRKVLCVLTDGDADNMPLCREVAEFYIRRGIEVVAIGIKSDSVKHWAPVSYVINDIKELPAALLSTIDPRAIKRRKAA
jgi:hypothetical protein